MTEQEQLSEDIRIAIDDLIAEAEDELGRELDDEERQSLIDEFLAGLEDDEGDGGDTADVPMSDMHRPFSEQPTTFHAFDDQALAPMTPDQALAYFRKLIPSLGVDPNRWGKQQERSAFTLAAAADEILLTAVQDLIAERLKTGEGIGTGPADIDALLDAAGVSSGNPQYSDMLMRTNVVDAFNTGSQRELSASSAIFPAYKYVNPNDGRSRAKHAENNGKYFSVDTPFVQVRGTEIEDAANCRCTFIPIDRWEWADLEAAGAQVETSW